jgi:hypothetical protein
MIKESRPIQRRDQTPAIRMDIAAARTVKLSQSDALPGVQESLIYLRQ